MTLEKGEIPMMKSLEQHNRERHEVYQHLSDLQKPHPNGIACPECGGEAEAVKGKGSEVGV